MAYKEQYGRISNRLRGVDPNKDPVWRSQREAALRCAEAHLSGGSRTDSGFAAGLVSIVLGALALL